jgi:hypothetical protein
VEFKMGTCGHSYSPFSVILALSADGRPATMTTCCYMLKLKFQGVPAGTAGVDGFSQPEKGGPPFADVARHFQEADTFILLCHS